ncbi:unnamed protein product [Dovyalis caffra]|uniref:Uncharacterized protein n=1 Tax=Dovyalis caffra TaxID=77055 RepID=A0AAV1QTP9_9ROSI|nr:unnamed protein product [Dovyalis caffra]
MLRLQCHNFHTLSPQIFPLSHHHSNHRSFSLNFLLKPTTTTTLSALPRSRPDPLWLAQLPGPGPEPELEEEGPIELLKSSPSVFATSDDPAPIQVATSVLLTGAIAVFLFRSLRRRAKRSKELKFRSSGAKKTLKEEALDSLKTIGSASIDVKKPPSPVQAFLGAISAGVIALILYKFTMTIEAALNRQTVTIVNGLCYLATFVFGINSVGLFLYSAQLAFNSLLERGTDEEIESKASGQSGSPNSPSESATDGADLTSSQGDQNPDNTQQ